MTTGLRRFVAPVAEPAEAQPALEKCELCTAPVPPEHGHLVDVAGRSLKCACRACWLLFTHDGAAQGRFRTVPDRYLHDPGLRLTDAQWDSLQVPVAMAFFFRQSDLDGPVAFYPSPAGATESLLPLDTWDELAQQSPLIGALEADVEAFLVRRHADGTYQCHLVPIDACYELVGRVRMTWKGFDGGEEAWIAIDAFFDAIAERSRPVEAA
ncbi:MAG: hypothetical protein QOJ09_2232 [Actinomycetota bacterium]|nr:hypothetical protein [Actinomycetota bacterium]